MPVKKAEPKTIDIAVVERAQFEACLLGLTPFIANRMAEKARQQLLLPPGRKSEVDKKTSLKHDPLEEFRSSPYIDRAPDGPTYLQLVASGVKMGMASIPLDLPDTGTSKAQLERLLFAPQERAPLWGVPQMVMSVVRNSDPNHTPDIRTRVIIPQWAAKVAITYVKPVLKQGPVERFLSAAGFMRGVGDWRPEKGSGNYGTFEIVDEDDPRFQHIVKTGNRAAQMAAMKDPDFYDEETRDLYQWFVVERDRRGFGEDGALKDGGNGKKRRRAVEVEETSAE